MPDRPPGVVRRNAIWNDGVGADPAKYLVNPGSISLAPGGVKASPGNLRHARPYLLNGSKFFAWPVGTEGFTRSGAAVLGLHQPIGEDSYIGVTVNREGARIELTGMFPGISAQDNMRDCLDVITSKQDDGMLLNMPGVFDNVQIVLPENWNFNHSEDDRTHSITYTISFVRVAVGKPTKDPHGKPPHQNPSVRKLPKGKHHKIFTVKSGARTFRAIAKVVYKNQNSWQKLVQLNEGVIKKYNRNHPDIPKHQLPTFRWAIGTKLRY
jgi:hypothetical protein